MSIDFSSQWEFRDALPTDAKEVVSLILAAYGPFSPKIAGSKDPQKILERMEYFFTHHKVGLVHYSHTEILMHKESGSIAGIFCPLRGDFVPIHFLAQAELLGLLLEKNPNDPDILYSVRECSGPIFIGPNELHLDIISIAPQFQGKGLTHYIIQRAKELAKEHAFHTISLLALKNNHALYHKLKFHNDREFHDAGETYTKFVMSV